MLWIIAAELAVVIWLLWGLGTAAVEIHNGLMRAGKVQADNPL